MFDLTSKSVQYLVVAYIVMMYVSMFVISIHIEKRVTRSFWTDFLSAVLATSWPATLGAVAVYKIAIVVDNRLCKKS